MNLKEVVCEAVDLIHLAQDTIQWTVCEHPDEASDSIKDGKCLD
jgi:hypothetical protein